MKVSVSLRGQPFVIEVDADPPLGWRFWTFAGFPGDPYDPRPYGGSRGIPLAFDGQRWITAMELDGSAQLFTPHSLFPCDRQDGAAEFGRTWIERHSVQPDLFAGAPA